MKSPDQKVLNNQNFHLILQEYIFLFKLQANLLIWNGGAGENKEDDDKRFTSLEKILQVLTTLRSPRFSFYHQAGQTKLEKLEEQYHLSGAQELFKHTLAHWPKFSINSPSSTKIFSLTCPTLGLQKGNSFDQLFEVIEKISTEKMFRSCVPFLIENLAKTLNENSIQLSADEEELISSVVDCLLGLPYWLDNVPFVNATLGLFTVLEKVLRPQHFETLWQSLPDGQIRGNKGIWYLYVAQTRDYSLKFKFFLQRRHSAMDVILGKNPEAINNIKEFLKEFQKKIKEEKQTYGSKILTIAVEMTLNIYLLGGSKTSDQQFNPEYLQDTQDNSCFSIHGYVIADSRKNSIIINPLYKNFVVRSADPLLKLIVFFIKEGSNFHWNSLCKLVKNNYFPVAYELFIAGAVRIIYRNFPWQAFFDIVVEKVFQQSDQSIINFDLKKEIVSGRYFLHQLLIILMQIPRFAIPKFVIVSEANPTSISSLSPIDRFFYQQYWKWLGAIFRRKKNSFNIEAITNAIQKIDGVNLGSFLNTQFGYLKLTPLMTMIIHAATDSSLLKIAKNLLSQPEMKINVNLKNAHNQTLLDLAVGFLQYEVIGEIIQNNPKKTDMPTASMNKQAIHLFLKRLAGMYYENYIIIHVIYTNIKTIKNILDFWAKVSDTDNYRQEKLEIALGSLVQGMEMVCDQPHSLPDLTLWKEAKDLRSDITENCRITRIFLKLVKEYIIISTALEEPILVCIQNNINYLEQLFYPELLRWAKDHTAQGGEIHSLRHKIKAQEEQRQQKLYSELSIRYQALYELIDQNIGLDFSLDEQGSRKKIWLLLSESRKCSELMTSFVIPDFSVKDKVKACVTRLENVKKYVAHVKKISSDEDKLSQQEQNKFKRFITGLKGKSALMRTHLSLVAIWKEIVAAYLQLPDSMREKKLTAAYQGLDARLGERRLKLEEKLKSQEYAEKYTQILHACESSLLSLGASLKTLERSCQKYPRVKKVQGMKSREIRSHEKLLFKLPEQEHFINYIDYFERNLFKFEDNIKTYRKNISPTLGDLSLIEKFSEELKKYHHDLTVCQDTLGYKISLLEQYSDLAAREVRMVAGNRVGEREEIGQTVDEPSPAEDPDSKRSGVSQEEEYPVIEITPSPAQSHVATVSAPPKIWLEFKGKGISFFADFKERPGDAFGTLYPAPLRDLRLSDYVDCQLENKAQGKMLNEALDSCRDLRAVKIDESDIEEVVALRSSYLYFISCLGNSLKQAPTLSRHWSIFPALYQRMNEWFVAVRDHLFHIFPFIDYNDLTDAHEQRRIKLQTDFLRSALVDIGELLSHILNRNTVATENSFDLLQDNPVLTVLAAPDVSEKMIRLNSPLFHVEAKSIASHTNFERMAKRLGQRIAKVQEKMQAHPEQVIFRHALAFYINHLNKLSREVATNRQSIPSFFNSEQGYGLLKTLRQLRNDCNQFRHALLPGKESHELVDYFSALRDSRCITQGISLVEGVEPFRMLTC